MNGEFYGSSVYGMGFTSLICYYLPRFLVTPIRNIIPQKKKCCETDFVGYIVPTHNPCWGEGLRMPYGRC